MTQQVEIPLKLELSPADVRRLSKAGQYGVRNAVRSVAKYTLDPARDQARKLSASGIKGKQRKGVTALRDGRTTYSVNGKQRKIRSYRAGVKKKGAYAMRGRADSIGDVTLLLSIKTNADYYNFVANFWEHGWTAMGRSLPGNEFMTRAVQRTMGEIKTRFARAMALAVEKSPKRLKAADLKGI